MPRRRELWRPGGLFSSLSYNLGARLWVQTRPRQCCYGDREVPSRWGRGKIRDGWRGGFKHLVGFPFRQCQGHSCEGGRPGAVEKPSGSRASSHSPGAETQRSAFGSAGAERTEGAPGPSPGRCRFGTSWPLAAAGQRPPAGRLCFRRTIWTPCGDRTGGQNGEARVCEGMRSAWTVTEGWRGDGLVPFLS